eukprot:4870505-Prymnesium_polylepis.1
MESALSSLIARCVPPRAPLSLKASSISSPTSVAKSSADASADAASSLSRWTRRALTSNSVATPDRFAPPSINSPIKLHASSRKSSSASGDGRPASAAGRALARVAALVVGVVAGAAGGVLLEANRSCSISESCWNPGVPQELVERLPAGTGGRGNLVPAAERGRLAGAVAEAAGDKRSGDAGEDASSDSESDSAYLPRMGSIDWRSTRPLASAPHVQRVPRSQSLPHRPPHRAGSLYDS